MKREQFLEQWSFPESVAERRIVREIRKLPVGTINKIDYETAISEGFEVRQCHRNVARIVEQAQDILEISTGWVPMGPLYILHSVVKVQGKNVYTCVTPMPDFKFLTMPYIPDTQISWVQLEGKWKAVRNGRLIGPGVRSVPMRVLLNKYFKEI